MVYAVLVTGYFFLVLHFLDSNKWDWDWAWKIFQSDARYAKPLTPS